MRPIKLAACNTLAISQHPRAGRFAAQEAIQLLKYCQRIHAELPALLVGALLAFGLRESFCGLHLVARSCYRGTYVE